jgi:hypothetical protein
MRILAILFGAAALTLGAPAHASGAPHPPIPPQAQHTVHMPSGAPHWVKCPGDPRLMMACFTH